MLTKHPTPWVALPCDNADMFTGVDLWFFCDANGKEVFYGHAMSPEVRDYILRCVNGASERKDMTLPQTIIDAVDRFGDLCAMNPKTGVKLVERGRLLGIIEQHVMSSFGAYMTTIGESRGRNSTDAAAGSHAAGAVVSHGI